VALPDFFLVGHAKCGTTALYEMLRQHPQIFMPGVKEPQFFAKNPGPSPPQGTFEQTGRRPMSFEQYLALFDDARPGQRVGEASTFYLWSPPAAERIARVQPAARIVAILREPASFLRSLHMQLVQNGVETEHDLGRAIELEADRRAGRSIPARAHWPATLIYSDRVRYADQLRRYHAVFPREQVLVLIYDDYIRDNAATVARVLEFLDVDPTVPLQLVSANPSVQVRSVRLHSALKDVRAGRRPAARAVREAVRTLTPSAVRREILHPLRERVIFRAPGAPDAELMDSLRHRFAPEVRALSDYLGRDLVSEWGYGDL
jgi:Sulfotransferase family